MRIFFNAPGDSKGGFTADLSAEAVAEIKKLAQTPLDQIVEQTFNPEPLPVGNTQLPLGDHTPAPGVNGQPPIRPATEPMITPPASVSPSNLIKELDELDQDISTATIDDDPNLSEASKNSFKGLKARYKNKITSFKSQVGALNTQIASLTAQLEDLPKIRENAKEFERVAPTVKQLEEENSNLKKENQTLSYYRRKYDLENDPTIRQKFVEPMQQLKDESMDILQNNNLDENFWHELVNSDSEYRINSLIDGNRITGLNAQSLKSYVKQYQRLSQEYAYVSSPETIESAIDTAKGHRLRNAAAMSQKVFNDVEALFATFVDEVKESEFNREHNHFVYDKVKAEATKYYDNLKKSIAPDQITQPVMHNFAKAALMMAAFPLQKKALEHAIATIGELKKEISEGGVSMRQTRESLPRGTTGASVEEIRNEGAKKTPDQIAQDVFGIR